MVIKNSNILCDTGSFYCATIAYQVELNAILGGRRHLANVQEKWTYNTGEMPWKQGDPSSDVAMYFLFLVGCEYGIHAFYCKERDLFYMDILVVGILHLNI